MTNQERAMEVLRKKLDSLEIKLGSYKAAESMLREVNVTPARAKGISEFFRRFIDG